MEKYLEAIASIAKVCSELPDNGISSPYISGVLDGIESIFFNELLLDELSFDGYYFLRNKIRQLRNGV